MPIKLTKRKGFNFFRSYYDVYNELETNEDKIAFIDALLDRQFLGVKPENLKGMAKFAYISQTNSIDSQVKGYEDKTGVKLYPTEPPTVGVSEPPAEQVEVKEKVQEQGKVKEKVKEDINSRKLKFAHTLTDFKSIYSREMLKEFYEYWTETNEGGKKFRREMQKTWNLKLRLKKWNDNNNKFKSNGKSKIVDTDEFKQINKAIRQTGVRR